MDLIGKTSIHPFLFYSGKISGYYTWIVLFLIFFKNDLIKRISLGINDVLSFILLIISSLFIIISLIKLGRSTRLGIPSEETVLKTGGIYKYSRNPMYVGFNLLTMASMIYTLNLWIVLPGLYSIIIYHFIIRGEENFLKDRFGESYQTYLTKVRRYI
jgi:protein-S-isoprenylcysteine O-methyltransferase Ste14